MNRILTLCVLALLAGRHNAEANSCEPYRAKYDQLNVGDPWTKISQVFGHPTTMEDMPGGDTVYVYEFWVASLPPRLADCTLTFRAGSENTLVAKGANPPINEVPERAAPTPAKDTVLPVGNEVSAPVVLYKIDPDYSEEARKAGMEGTVGLQLVVDASGHPRDVRIVRSLGLGLDEKAIEAVNHWKFRPGFHNGLPVAVMATITVNFHFQEVQSTPWQVTKVEFVVPKGTSRPRLTVFDQPSDRRRGDTAKVSTVLHFEVGTDGIPRNLTFEAPLSDDMRADLSLAATRWRFTPAERDGVPVLANASFDFSWDGAFAQRPFEQASVNAQRRLDSSAPAEQTRNAIAPAKPVSSQPSTPAGTDLQLGYEAYQRNDYAGALRKWLPLAEQGDPLAEVGTGACFCQLGDYVKAVQWFQKAADAGSPVAYEWLGHCYGAGQGFGRDYLQAQMWYTLAGPLGSPQDKTVRAEVLAHVTTAERDKAWKMATAWLCSRGRPFVSKSSDGMWTDDSFVHSVASSRAILPEKAISHGDAIVYAIATRNKGRLWTRVCVWNVGNSGEVSVDPHQFWVEVTDDKNSLTLRAMPPSKVMGAGRTAATMQAVVTSLGSNRRTATVSGTDVGTGNIYSGTVTYNDPELERQRAEAVQRILEQQTAREQSRASFLLWPTVLQPTYYIRGGVEFHKVPDDTTHIVLRVPINGLVYSFPFAFQGKDGVGR